MFGTVKDFFTESGALSLDKSGKPCERDLQIAACMLFLDVAQTDSKLAPEEIRSVVSTMNNLFNLTDDEVGSLIAIAEVIRKDTDKVDKFISELNANFTDDQRQILLGMVWRVVNADGRVDDFEATYAANVRDKLKLTLEQGVRARQMMEE